MTPVRVSADERLRRLLAMVPWVAGQDGPSVEEVCQRFDYTEPELAADLELLWMCGVHPFSPGDLIEADVAEGRVWIRMADFFTRPLRLTPTEALAIMAAGQALLAVPGTDPEGPLARGLAKLAAVMGIDPEEVVEVDLGEVDAGVLTVVREAADARLQLEVSYFSHGRGQWATRTIEPHVVFSSAGAWYVSAHCHRVGGVRLFRVDRVRDPKLLEVAFEHRVPEGPVPPVYDPRPDDPSVTIELEPAARWVAEQLPHDAAELRPDGRLRVTLRVSEHAWLERLLLKLGPDGRVVDGPGGVAAAAARRVLARYAPEPRGA